MIFFCNDSEELLTFLEELMLGLKASYWVEGRGTRVRLPEWGVARSGAAFAGVMR